MKHLAVAIVALGLVVAACGDSSTDTTEAALLPGLADADGLGTAGFNPYWPMTVGSTWTYEGTDADEVERIEVVVTGDAKQVEGYDAIVIRDTVTIDGELVEDTYDWYLVDAETNVWYVGEDSKEYEDGEVVSTVGSWESGVDGATAGVIMWSDPVARTGTVYYQEFYEGEAEDKATVVRVEPTVTVAAGTFTDVLVIEETNPLEPGIVEEKYYAPGVGMILEQKIAGEEGRVELLSYSIAG